MQQVIGDVQTLYYESDGIVGYHLNGDIAKWDDVMPDLWAETPSTDAFLDEVRAQGVDVARNAMIDFVEGEVGPNENVPGLIRAAEICVSIAAQLRKGVQS